jgi:transposase
MGKPYAQDLRERVIAAVDTGTGAYVAAPLFRLSISYIYKALIRRRTIGELTARASGGGTKPKLALHDDALRARIAAQPDITFAELQTWLLVESGVKVGCLGTGSASVWFGAQKSRNGPPDRIAPIRQSSRGMACEPGWPEPGTPSLHTWRGAMAVAHVDSARSPAAHWTLGENDVHRRLTARRDRCALCVRWTHERREFSRLCRAMPCSHLAAWRCRHHG